jgi:hypothetical protein
MGNFELDQAQIINLTEYTINVIGEDGKTISTYLASQTPAHVNYDHDQIGRVYDVGQKNIFKVFSSPSVLGISNLPDFDNRSGNLYIVTDEVGNMVAAMGTRPTNDLLVPTMYTPIGIMLNGGTTVAAAGFRMVD